MAAQTTYPPVHGDRLPRTIEVNGEPVTLRLMSPSDATPLHTFFQELAEEHPRDLLFLRRDVTSGREIDGWVVRLVSGETITVLAVANGEILGEASLDRSPVPWTEHVGNVRVVVSWPQRGRGLSRILLGELSAIALASGVERLVAEMMAEQSGACRLFASLGYVEEGRYPAFARDREGKLHDMVVMTARGPALERAIPA